MDPDFVVEVELGGAVERFPQNLCFDLQLIFVAGVLVVASTASGEVRARGRDTVRGRFNDGIDAGAGESGLLFGERSLDTFAREDEGKKNGLTAAVGFAGGRFGGNSRQAVAAVDQLFNCEEQD